MYSSHRSAYTPLDDEGIGGGVGFANLDDEGVGGGLGFGPDDAGRAGAGFTCVCARGRDVPKRAPSPDPGAKRPIHRQGMMAMYTQHNRANKPQNSSWTRYVNRAWWKVFT